MNASNAKKIENHLKCLFINTNRKKKIIFNTFYCDIFIIL